MKLIQLEEWQFEGSEPAITFETHPEPMHIAKVITNIEAYGQLVPIIVEPIHFAAGFTKVPTNMYRIVEGEDIKIAIDFINKQRSVLNHLFYWAAWEVAAAADSKPWLDTLRDSIRQIERGLG